MESVIRDREVRRSDSREVSEWLSRFGAALDRADFAAASEMFADDCYWRDLVCLTWNIKTLEGKQQIQAMLEVTVLEAKPGQWRIDGEATSQNGVIESWFTFETAVSRGKGHLRLKEGKCWTLLTTMTELKGFEEKKGETRAKGVLHGIVKDRRNWAEQKAQEEADLGYAKQPYCVIIGGGQGGIDRKSVV